MRTRSRRTKTCAILAALVFPLSLAAQSSSSGSSPANSAPQPASALTNTSNSPASSQSGTTSTLDYLYNKRPQDGSAAKEASSVGRLLGDRAKAMDSLPVTGIDDPAIRARFDKYLGMAAVPPDRIKNYMEQMGKVQERLSARKPWEALNQLVVMADFTEIDAGVSGELAARMESIWNTDQTNQMISKANDNLRDEIDRANRSADMMSESVREKELEYMRKESYAKQRGDKGSSGGGSVPFSPAGSEGSGGGGVSMAGLEGKIRLTEEYLKSLEAKARIKLNEMRMEKLVDQAKADFASYISTLGKSGRHYHVVLAADFYRRLFDEGDYPVEMANQVNAALEINREVASAIEVFKYKAGRNEIMSASERLQEAFLLNEYHPAVVGLERGQKEKVAVFMTKLTNMQNLLEAREFGELEKLLEAMPGIAADFDITKPKAMVNAVKLESKMRLGKAKLAAQQGNLPQAMEEFQSAAEAWPGNPDLQMSAEQFFSVHDAQNQSIAEFDRLLEENNLRGIFEKQLAYAPAIRGDKEREEKLKAALEKVQKAEMASEKANLLLRSGDYFGAWEAIELASEEWPDDQKLNKLRADLSGKSAEFVASINKAKDAENRKELGYSLTWYLNAQRQYPASRLANDAISRIGKEILDPTAPAASGD
jgi:hypothetical protein